MRFGKDTAKFGGGNGNAGRPLRTVRLVPGLRYLKQSVACRGEERVEREQVRFLAARLGVRRIPAAVRGTPIGGFQRAIGEAGRERLLTFSIGTAA